MPVPPSPLQAVFLLHLHLWSSQIHDKNILLLSENFSPSLLGIRVDRPKWPLFASIGPVLFLAFFPLFLSWQLLLAPGSCPPQPDRLARLHHDVAARTSKAPCHSNNSHLSGDGDGDGYESGSRYRPLPRPVLSLSLATTANSGHSGSRGRSSAVRPGRVRYLCVQKTGGGPAGG